MRRPRAEDEQLEVTTRPPRLRGGIRLARPGRSSGEFGGFLGVPWWVWMLAASGGVAVLVWWLTSRGEPDPEVNPVAPDLSLSPTVDLLDVGDGFKLAREAALAFIDMRAAALAAGIELSISTAWRSLEFQQRLYDAYLAFKEGRGPWAPLAAKPGQNAPHQKGIALDLNGVDPRKSNFNAARRAWLEANAGNFGWRNAGSAFGEPWHWEFIGRPSVA